MPLVERLDSEIVLIKIGDEDEKITILSEARLLEIKKLIDSLSSNPPKGLIITGASEKMFSAGADINVIQSVYDQSEGRDLASKGQEIYAAIEQLECPTVAAISGPCVGGACELALACDYRVISDSASSSIGLPEVKIGILPGFGGTQRMPRLIGLRKSLSLILTGKVLKPHQAQAVGLVDQICSYSSLIETAEDYILNSRSKHKLKFTEWLITYLKPLRNYVAKQARQRTLSQTKGRYPAPIKALECVIYGLEHGLEKGYQKEANELGELIVTQECKALTNLFFLTEASKSIGKQAREHVNGLNAIVIGAGIMGSGISGEFARTGINVFMKDTKQEAVDKGIAHIRKILSKRKSLTEETKQSILSKIHGIVEYPEQLGEVNFAIEAIFEDLDLKKSVLGEVAGKIPEDSIIASNTSSLSISAIAEGITNPSRVVGMHFFNPVARMPLIEIVRGKETSDQVICLVAALASKLSKFPIVVEDVPGFLVNRILTPYLNEAVRLLEEGYAIEDIDRAALKFGMPMGPIRLLDEVGLDVAAHVSKTLVDGYGKRMEAPNFAEKLLQAGRKGKKGNIGFYNFIKKPEQADPEIYKILNITEQKPADDEKIENRLIMSLIAEAILCLDEGVAGAPGKDAASQIDLGSVMGFGFPAFRGGLIYYAETLGAAKIVNLMQELERQVDARFRPIPSLMARAEKGKGFYES